MVQIHVKQSEERQFLYECTATQSVDTIIRDVASIHCLQMRIQYLYIEGEQLSLYGPAKPDDNGKHPDTEEENASSSSKIRGPFYKKDPSGKRNGEACDPKCAETLRRTLSEADAYVSKNQVHQKIPLELGVLKDHIQNIKGAVMICYPMGLPNYDPVEQLLSGTFKGEETFDPDTAQLWWAGKELMRDKELADHAGKNEKTKIIAKLQGRGHGPPPREPPVDKETQEAMMAWYHKQQQEKKVPFCSCVPCVDGLEDFWILEPSPCLRVPVPHGARCCSKISLPQLLKTSTKLDDEEDGLYMNSSWANPKSMKSQFHGLSVIRYG